MIAIGNNTVAGGESLPVTFYLDEDGYSNIKAPAKGDGLYYIRIYHETNAYLDEFITFLYEGITFIHYYTLKNLNLTSVTLDNRIKWINDEIHILTSADGAELVNPNDTLIIKLS